jgi:anti-sigma factor RsiW
MKRAVPVLAIAVAIGLTPNAAASAGPLDDARDALEAATFTGRMAVTWVDGARTHRTSVTLRADHGSIEVDGPVPIVKGFGSHFVRMSSGWSDLAPVADIAQPATHKYAVHGLAEAAAVAGRPTVALEVRIGDRLRERMWLDRELGVVLKREQFDDRGALARRVEFTSFASVAGDPHYGRPRRFRPEEPSPMGASVRAPFRAPAVLDGGYHRVGVYRRGELMHVVYGDGVYGLSVFEQPGHLDWDGLPPSGHVTAVAGHRARRYVWPGGQLVTWQAGGSAYTVVGDGPVTEVLAAAASLRPARSLSGAQRVRQTARELVETLSGR